MQRLRDAVAPAAAPAGALEQGQVTRAMALISQQLERAYDAELGGEGLGGGWRRADPHVVAGC
jgi:hypothetical protein